MKRIGVRGLGLWHHHTETVTHKGDEVRRQTKESVWANQGQEHIEPKEHGCQ